MQESEFRSANDFLYSASMDKIQMIIIFKAPEVRQVCDIIYYKRHAVIVEPFLQEIWNLEISGNLYRGTFLWPYDLKEHYVIH